MKKNPDEKSIVTFNTRRKITGTFSSTFTALISQMSNVIINTYFGYVRKQKLYATSGSQNITGSLDGNSVAWFRNVYTASAPTNILATGINDFIFFVNGQNIEPGTYTMTQQGSDLNLTISTGSVGFELEDTDELVVWGLFE